MSLNVALLGTAMVDYIVSLQVLLLTLHTYIDIQTTAASN